MKVRVCWEDGHYWLVEYTDNHAAAGLCYVEVDDNDWREYLEWRETGREWHDWMRKLDNKQYCEDHGEEYVEEV